jgi:hypothetical protein
MIINTIKVEIILIGVSITSVAIPTQDDTPYPEQSQKQKELIAKTPHPSAKGKNE